MLAAPTSPAFVLMGIEPASVEHPTTVKNIAFSILNSSDNISTLPRNYALELAPYWLFAGRGLTYAQFARPDNVVSTIQQTLTISLASSTTNNGNSDSSVTSLGAGFRFSLVQGHVDTLSDNFAAKYHAVIANLRTITTAAQESAIARQTSDPVLQNLKESFIRITDEADSLEQKLSSATDETQRELLALRISLLRNEASALDAQKKARRDEIYAEDTSQVRQAYQENFQAIRDTISKMEFKRVGPKIDLAGAITFDFPGRVFDKGKWSKWGVWVTGGNEGANWSILGVLRLIDEHTNSHLVSFDVGERIIYRAADKFSVSVEGLYRRLGKEAADRDQWRLALVCDYAIAHDHSLSLTFGRDFEGNRTGNVLALVNLILGFGTNRPFLPAESAGLSH